MTNLAAIVSNGEVILAEAERIGKQALLFPPEVAQYILYLGVGIPLIILVGIYFQHRSLRQRPVIAASLTIPFLIAVTALTPPAFEGSPDDRCPEYWNGNLPFQLIHVSEEPVAQNNPYGDTRLLLLVLAPEMWGDNPHLCRLDRGDERMKKLFESLKRRAEMLADEFISEGGGERGHLVFTFGSGTELPNVTLKLPPSDSNKKTGPAEVRSSDKKGSI